MRETWKHTRELAGQLTAYHFPHDPVVVQWKDGSRARWQWSFWRNEGAFIAVYTEHCGYFTLSPESILSIDGSDRPQDLTEEQRRECEPYLRKGAPNSTAQHVPELASAEALTYPDTPVQVTWEDESEATWENAFWRREGRFVAVYSESAGVFVLFLGEDDRIEGQDRS